MLLFIMIVGFISLGINIDRASTTVDSLEEELINNQVILSSTIDELNETEESLLAEIERSNKLSESLKITQEELNIINAELESANTTISDLKKSEYKLVYMGNFKYTYYCDERYEHICGYGQGLTASGKPTEVGWTVAADTSVLPMGSIIYVEGIGFREVMDRGGGVNGKHIDILMTTHNECFKQTIIHGGVWVLVKNGS
jgi:3D (Asp-Asp-Asp) domain-containing protein